jgi:N-acetylglucosamine malate deacetylase 1
MNHRCWMNMFERTLVVVPHADDEALGAGGLISRLSGAGKQVTVVIAATGDIDFEFKGRVDRARRRAEAEASLKVLGVSDWTILFEGMDSLLDTLPRRDLITRLDGLINERRPTAFLAPYPSHHQDHKTVYEACMAALRPRTVKGDGDVRFAAMYEYPYFDAWNHETIRGGKITLAMTEDDLNVKIAALKCHKSQLDPIFINTDVVRLWARYRGSEIGAPCGESFYLLRMNWW